MPCAGLIDLDFYQATAVLPALRHVTNKRAKLTPGRPRRIRTPKQSQITNFALICTTSVDKLRG
jgi:hypothetical protein